MKLSRTSVVVPVVGLLFAIGAGAVLATAGPSATPDRVGTPPAAESPAPSTGIGKAGKPENDDSALHAVLDRLVAKGTITAAQETAILDGVSAERTARNEERKAARQQLRDFLADGQITADELAKLPADSPLRTLTSLMDDGKITVDELRSLGKGMGKGLGIGNGHGNGWLKPHASDDADDDASPSPAG